MKEIIVVNGVHGSGKSTIAQMLVKDQGDRCAFFTEIGGQLRREVGYNALQSSETFDDEVMRRELLRDRDLLRCNTTPVVETWHIGNLGYAKVRSPKMVINYFRAFEEQLGLFEPTVVILEIGWETFRQRATERIKPGQMEELINFYSRIFEEIHRICDYYQIKNFSVNNDGRLDTSFKKVKKGLHERDIIIK